MLPKNYHRDWQRNKAKENPSWYQERKENRTQKRRDKKKQWVNVFGSKCSKCGGEFPDCVFDFHHTHHEEKEIKPSLLFMLSDERIKEELSKCVMLCANCHRIVHSEDNYIAHTKREFKNKE